MSLQLLIDEDSQDKRLVKLLRDVGHNVVTVNELELMGQPDSVIFASARNSNRLILTFNCDDFQFLHEGNPNHPGILVIYHNADLSKNMSFKAIVKAIANLEASMISLTKQFISLNQWNY